MDKAVSWRETGREERLVYLDTLTIAIRRGGLGEAWVEFLTNDSTNITTVSSLFAGSVLGWIERFELS